MTDQQPPAPAPTAQKNGTPVVAQPPSPAAVKPPVSAAPPKSVEPDPKLQELDRQTRRIAAESQKLAKQRQEIEAKGAEFAKQQQEYQAWKAEHADRLRNPAKYLSKEYGEDWYDKFTQLRMNGTPTPDLLASELDNREAHWAKKLEESEAKSRQLFEQLQNRELERERTSYESGVRAELQKHSDKFPFVAGLVGTDFDPTGLVLQELQNDFQKKARKTSDGRVELTEDVLTVEAAAEIIQKRIEAFGSLYEAAKSKKSAATPPSTQQPLQRNEIPQRRTLSNDMAASSPGSDWTPPKDDKERTQRAYAALDRHIAAKANRQQ